MTPKIINDSTSWFLLVNLELLLGYCFAYKLKVFSINSTKSTAVLLIIGMALVLCFVTQLKGFLVVLLACLSFLSQITHAQTFEISKKKSRDYSTKSTIRDTKSELMFYR